MSMQAWQEAAELPIDDHPDDAGNWPLGRRYATSSTRRRDGHYPRNQTSHIVVYRVDYLPDAWMPACRRVIRGTVSDTPPLRLCQRCQREVGE